MGFTHEIQDEVELREALRRFYFSASLQSITSRRGRPQPRWSL